MTSDVWTLAPLRTVETHRLHDNDTARVVEGETCEATLASSTEEPASPPGIVHETDTRRIHDFRDQPTNPYRLRPTEFTYSFGEVRPDRRNSVECFFRFLFSLSCCRRRDRFGNTVSRAHRGRIARIRVFSGGRPGRLQSCLCDLLGCHDNIGRSSSFAEPFGNTRVDYARKAHATNSRCRRKRFVSHEVSGIFVSLTRRRLVKRRMTNPTTTNVSRERYSARKIFYIRARAMVLSCVQRA